MVVKIPISEPIIAKNQKKYVNECLDTNWISSTGKFIGLFEKNFSNYIGKSYGVSVANGTVALHLALTALGIKNGAEVIVPDLTFVATANAVSYCGAKPVLVDADMETWCIDPKLIEKKITNKTKAIIPVHLYGHPCDMDLIMQIAKKHGLFVVEDVAEGIGAKINHRMAGTYGAINCFSFYGNKIITTGEGGMCLTDQKELYEKMIFLKNHGMSQTKRYYHPTIGFNYRMTNIQAAIGTAQLEEIDSILKTKRDNANLYNSMLKNIEGLTMPPETSWAENCYWLYSILVDEKEFGMSRDGLIENLKDDGIDSRRFFYPMHELPPYHENNGYLVSSSLSKRGMNLPSGATLGKKEIESICKAIIKCSKKALFQQ
jgi:perosamine synthetase